MTADLQDLLRDSARRLPMSGPTDLDAVVRRGRALRARRRRRDVVLGLGSAAAVVALGVALVPGAFGSRALVGAGAGAGAGVTPPPASGPLVPLATNGAEVYVGVTPGKSPEPVTGDLLARWVAQQVAAALPESAAVDIDGAELTDVPDPGGAEGSAGSTSFGRVVSSLVIGGERVPLQLALGTGFSILCTLPLSSTPTPVSAPAPEPVCTQADMMAGTTSWRTPLGDSGVAAQAMDARAPSGGQSWTADAVLPRVPAASLEQAGVWAEKAAVAAAQAITDRPFLGDPAWAADNRPSVTPSASASPSSSASTPPEPSTAATPLSAAARARWVLEHVAAALPASAAVALDGVRTTQGWAEDPGSPISPSAGDSRPTYGTVETTVELAGQQVLLEISLGTQFGTMCLGSPVQTLPSGQKMRNDAKTCVQGDPAEGATSWRTERGESMVAAQVVDTRPPLVEGRGSVADAALPDVPAGSMAQAARWAELAATAAAEAMADLTRPTTGEG